MRAGFRHRPSSFLFILALCTFQTADAQWTLAIRQVELNAGTIPALIFGDDPNQVPKRLNDSTIQFNVSPSQEECLFIIIDPATRWFTRVWIDSAITHKELIINYFKRTATIKDGSEADRVLEKVLALSGEEDRSESDSISVAYIEKNPDSFFSLWLLSHGLNRDHPRKNLPVLEKLSPRLKTYPAYRQVKAGITARKYPNIGDPFKEFVLPQKNDSLFDSNTIKNKWILLDFWATTCGPCIKSMDAYVNLYKSIDTSKVEFISVSLDMDKERWQRSETTKKIIWYSVWQEDNFYGDLCLNYNVYSMPFFILFNDEKKIVFIKDGANEIENIKRALLAIK